MNPKVLVKAAIVTLVVIGFQWKLAWLVALVLYEFKVRKGRDVVALWLEGHFRNRH